MVSQDKRPLRAKIRQIGRVVQADDGRPRLEGWIFDCLGHVPAVHVIGGTVLYAGWTLDELAAMAKAKPKGE